MSSDDTKKVPKHLSRNMDGVYDHCNLPFHESDDKSRELIKNVKLNMIFYSVQLLIEKSKKRRKISSDSLHLNISSNHQ